MLEVAEIETIRRLHEVKGWSIRKIAKELRHSRRTVAKYLQRDESTAAPRYRLRRPRPRPKTEVARGIIERILAEDRERPRKQRHTAHRIYCRLKEEYGIHLSESMVRRLVRELRPREKDSFIPLSFAFGENAQVDWGKARILERGVLVWDYVFHMRLSASGAEFVMSFPNDSLESFLEGHVRAFEYFGGVPRTITYDNLKSAVTKIIGRDRVLQKDFVALKAHYLFEAVFANPAAGNEKGGVENLVGTVRRNFFVPMPAVDSFEEMNELHRRQLDEQWKNEERLRLWTEERRHLLPLPKAPFLACRTVPVKVNSLSLVTHRGARYSVPSRLVGRTLLLRAFWDRVEIVDQDQIVATHRRLPAGRSSLSLEHYLDLLGRKPGAVRHAAFIAEDAELAGYRDEFLRARPQQYREFVEILRLKVTAGTHFSEAVRKARESRIYDLSGFNALLDAMRKPTPVPNQKQEIRIPSLREYDRLAGGAYA